MLVYSTGVYKTSLQYMYTQNQIIFFVIKLAAQKYSFNLIYKHLTWAASENSSKCLLNIYRKVIFWDKMCNLELQP